jgi:ubiquinone/menaquinone biosynthesis C-methylase UbiE
MGNIDDELERARRVYAALEENPAYISLYEPLRPANLFTTQERMWILADLLRRSGVSTLAGLDILDVGCGGGIELRRLTTIGASPDRLAGIDLMPYRVEAARRILPLARIEIGSAHEMPFLDASFDIVSQFVVFSSVVDPQVRRAIAAEMLRVLRPGGLILWWDIRKVRPTPNIVPISMSEIRAIFPGCSIKARPATLGWKAVHLVAPRSRTAALVLQRLPFLCSHWAAAIKVEPRAG